MRTRKVTVIAASVGVAVAAATGVTYASSALESAPKSASAITDAAPAPRGGNGTGTSAGSNAANAPADAGSSDSYNGPRKGNEGRGAGRGEHHRDEGQIQVNERVYGAEPGSCIAVVNVRHGHVQGGQVPSVQGQVVQGPGRGQEGADSFNIRNDSGKTVEFFKGITCDNGAPVATVGPHSSSSAVEGDREGQLLLGSFRVVGNGHW